MKAFKIEIGRNNAFSFDYFLSFEEAFNKVMEAVTDEHNLMKKNSFDISIKEIEIYKCRCGRLYEDECLRCEELRYDAMMERKMEREEQEEQEGEEDEKIQDN